MVEIMATVTGMRHHGTIDDTSLAKMTKVFEAACRRQAEAIAAHDPGGVEIDAEMARLCDWPED